MEDQSEPDVGDIENLDPDAGDQYDGRPSRTGGQDPEPEPRPRRTYTVPDDLTEAEILANLLADFETEEGVYIEVYRMGPRNTRPYMGKYDIEEFSLDAVQDDYGGGKYQFRLKGPKGKRLGAQTVEIFGAPKDPKANPAEESFAKIMAESQKEIRALIDDVKNPPAAAQAENPIRLSLALLGAIQGMQAPYLEALLSRKDDGPTARDMAEMFIEGMQMAQNMAPAENPYQGVIQTFAPMLNRALGAGADAMNSAAASRPTTPNPGAQRMPPNQNPRPGWDMALSQFVPTLQSWASQDKDARLRAEIVVDDLPQQVLPMLVEQLGRGEVFMQEFFSLHPETKPFEGWYRAFWQAVADQFDWEAEDSDADDDDGNQDDGPEKETVPAA